MNLIQIDAQLHCPAVVAEQMVGQFDHVEYHAGVARLRHTLTSPDDLLSAMRDAIDHIERELRHVGIHPSDSGLEFTVATEALVEEHGAYRRRGEVVLPAQILGAP